MKTHAFYRLLTAVALFFSCSLIFADPASVTTRLLVGKWHATEQHPVQRDIETDFIINEDNTFSVTLALKNVPVWQYAGTWSLQGNRITRVYLESNIILLQEDKEDTDVILSVNDESLTYRSLRHDKESTLRRVK